MEHWMEVSIDTTPEGIEPVSGLLLSLGVSGLQIEDEADFLNFLDQNKTYWDYVDEALRARNRGVSRVKCYLPDDEAGRKALGEIQSALKGLPERVPGSNLGPLALGAARVRSEDWENNWKAYYRPFPVGERLFIIPEWERETPVPEGRVPLYLNPGLIFGTGSHASTRLCLRALEGRVRPGDRVLDLGCGSGILSLAALGLGASAAWGCDIDPKAAAVVRENGARNGIGPERLAVCTGDILSDGRLRKTLSAEPYALIFANIVADVILALAAWVPAWLRPEGVFLCSGILEERAAEVAAALDAAGLTRRDRTEEDGWVCFAASRG